MFDPKDEIAEAVGAAYAVAAGMRRGQILPHEAISEATGLRPNRGRWGYIIGKVKRLLEVEKGITLWSVPRVGYKLCGIDDQFKLYRKRLQFAGRHIDKGRGHIESVRDEEMTEHDRRVQSMLSDRAKDMDAAMRAEDRGIAALFRATPVVPRRAI